MRPCQSVRVAERERPQQDGVDDTEDRDVGADSQSQHQDDNGGKRAVAPQSAQAEADVLDQCLEEIAGEGLAGFLPEALVAAKLDACAPRCLGTSEAGTFQIVSAVLDV